jgi:hypothetical protein
MPKGKEGKTERGERGKEKAGVKKDGRKMETLCLCVG